MKSILSMVILKKIQPHNTIFLKWNETFSMVILAQNKQLLLLLHEKIWYSFVNHSYKAVYVLLVNPSLGNWQLSAVLRYFLLFKNDT